MGPVREAVDEALAGLAPEEAELLARVLTELATRSEAAAAPTPGPERVYRRTGTRARC
jgi:hypothetical protein